MSLTGGTASFADKNARVQQDGDDKWVWSHGARCRQLHADHVYGNNAGEHHAGAVDGTAPTGFSKTYDGTTSSSGPALVTVGTIFPGDSANFSEAFQSKNVMGFFEQHAHCALGCGE